MAFRSIWLFPLVFAVLSIVQSPLGPQPAQSASLPGDLPLWSAGDPDPTYPFSDRFPVAVVVSSEEEARSVVATGIEVESVRPFADGWIIEANVNEEGSRQLRGAGYDVHKLRNLALEEFRLHPPGTGGLRDWPTYDQLISELQGVASANPSICRMIPIGTSVQGRTIWMMKISDNPDTEENEPEFKFTSSIHGDEVTGMELCRRLIHYLVDNYGTDPTVTSYVNGIEIWICPMHNPDGFVNGTRYNAHGVDLNREFPDPITDPIDTPDGREPENQAFMYLGYDHRFVLSANYHGGALVVNYPWDSHVAYTPDDEMIETFSLGYSYRNPPMWNSSQFYHGVTIGWDWYIVNGGMQDWCYEWRSDIDVTIEVSTTKWPPYSAMDTFWSQNRDAMLYYMSRTLTGVGGIVTDANTGLPLDATVDVVEIGKTIRTDPDAGDYHRLLLPGTYTLQVEAAGYLPQTIPGIVVLDGPATVRDVALLPLPTYEVSGHVTEQGTGLPLPATVRAYRHSNQELVAQASTEPATGAYSIGLQADTYDLRVSAAGHVGEERQIEVTGDRVEDFALRSMAEVVLVVQDGAQTRIATDLAAIGLPYHVETAAATDPAAWSEYRCLVWSAGPNGDPVADASKRAALEAYAGAGGRLLIEGGQIGYDTFQNPGYPSFGAHVLHGSGWHTNNAGDLILSEADHPVATTPNLLSSTIDIQYVTTGDEDSVTPLAGATLIYRTTSYAGDAGILAFDDDPDSPATGQILYYAFSYDRLADTANARRLLENSIAWLRRTDPAAVPDVEGGSRFALGAAFPNPASGTVRFRLESGSGAAVFEGAIFDVRGRRVAATTSGSLRIGGGLLEWDGRLPSGEEAPAGVYWLRARVDGRDETRSFLRIR
ncbi:MAG: M14 family zinc carboxypeptidase [Candidatus Eisenbacteria bacterium]|nr:M14 family zinc carboxypeptidase [Candidatus Eisenbacteria bacterium]